MSAHGELRDAVLVWLGGRADTLVFNAPTGDFLWPSGEGRVRIGPKGRSDILGWFEPADLFDCALFLSIEIKTGEGYLKPAQKRWRDRVNRAGGLYMVARRLADVQTVFPYGPLTLADLRRRLPAFQE